MPRKKEKSVMMTGGQLLTHGDIIRIMDGGVLTKCKVLSCIAGPEGSCHAGLEILEGERKGERIQTTIKASSERLSTE
jgi:hypothetical protein